MEIYHQNAKEKRKAVSLGELTAFLRNESRLYQIHKALRLQHLDIRPEGQHADHQLRLIVLIVYRL